MNNDHVHSATTKLNTAIIYFASFFVKPPNKISTNNYFQLQSMLKGLQLCYAALPKKITYYAQKRANYAQKRANYAQKFSVTCMYA